MLSPSGSEGESVFSSGPGALDFAGIKIQRPSLSKPPRPLSNFGVSSPKDFAAFNCKIFSSIASIFLSASSRPIDINVVGFFSWATASIIVLLSLLSKRAVFSLRFKAAWRFSISSGIFLRVSQRASNSRLGVRISRSLASLKSIFATPLSPF